MSEPAGTSETRSTDGPADAAADALPVLAEVRAIEPARPAPLQAATAAAVAATGFAAGAATVAVLRHRQRAGGKPRRRARARGRGKRELPVVSTRSFLVDVHLLGRE